MTYINILLQTLRSFLFFLKRLFRLSPYKLSKPSPCHHYLRQFRKDAPFKYDSTGIYDNLDDMHIKIKDMEAEMKGLADSASLFEVNMPEFKQLKGCRKEVKLLKVSKEWGDK